MLLIRKILFWVFAAIYIIVCPLLILYSLGYIYSPLKQEVVRTGVVNLSTLPRDADIFLENSRYTRQTPAAIEELMPGRYNITIKKKGYKNWTHTISIDAGKAVSFENILLIPDQRPVKKISNNSYKDLLPLNNRHLFIVGEDSTLGSYFICDKDLTLKPLLDHNSPFSEFSVNKLYHPAKDGGLIVYGGSFLDKSVLYLDIAEKAPAATDITEIFNGRPSAFIWQTADSGLIYTLQDNCINQINIKENLHSPCLLKDTKGFGIYKDWIYAIDSNGIFSRQPLKTGEQEILFEDITLTKQLFGSSDFYGITVKNGVIVFLGANGDFTINIPPYRIADEGVIGFDFHPDHNLLLYWTRQSIGIADFTGKFDKTVFQEKFTVRPVYKNTGKISQCFWAYEDSHILYNDDDTVYLIELLPQGPDHIELICRVKKDSSVFYDYSEHSMYYLDEKDGTLNKLQIVPQDMLFDASDIMKKIQEKIKIEK